MKRNILFSLLAILFVGALFSFSVFQVKIADKKERAHELWLKTAGEPLDTGIRVYNPVDEMDPVDDAFGGGDFVKGSEISEIPLRVTKPKTPQLIDPEPDIKDIPVITTPKASKDGEPPVIPQKVLDTLDGVAEKDIPVINKKVDKPAKVNSKVDYEPVLDERQAKRPRIEKMNWRKSIVDLLKLIFRPHSRSDREEMARDFGYKGPDGSYERNVWLHRQVRKKLETGEIPLDK